MQSVVRIHQRDNVVVALKPLKSGDCIALEDDAKVTVRENVPEGHKVAIMDIPEYGNVIKYGHRIGTAKRHVLAGEWIHTHNIKTTLADVLTYQYEPKQEWVQPKKMDVTFQGFVRMDGKVGVRNEIWIIPTVGLS